MGMEGIYGIRGATTVPSDFPQEVDDAVREMMDLIYRQNEISDRDIAAIIFSQMACVAPP